MQTSISNTPYWSLLSLPKQSPCYSTDVTKHPPSIVTLRFYADCVNWEERDKCLGLLVTKENGFRAVWRWVLLKFSFQLVILWHIVSLSRVSIGCHQSTQFYVLVKMTLHILRLHNICMSHNTTPGCLNMYLYNKKLSLRQWKDSIEKGVLWWPHNVLIVCLYLPLCEIKEQLFQKTVLPLSASGLPFKCSLSPDSE